MKTISDRIFEKLKENVIEIADNSFSKSSIEEAILTEGFKYIGLNAFSDCEKLHQVVFSMQVF